MVKKIFILGINGSPRKKGNTVKFLNIILKSAKKAGAEVKLINLVDKNIKPCLGCYSVSPQKCTFPCIQKDDMGEIYKLIIRADGMVLGSPAYWFSVSGLMKNFLDRLTSLEQSELLEGKIAGAVAVAEETGGDEVVSYLIHTLNQMGFLIPPFGGAFFSSKRPLDGSWREKDLSNLGRNIVKLAKVLKKERLFLD